MEKNERLPYEKPEIIDTFEALEVLGAAEGTQGNEPGHGSSWTGR